MRTRDEQRSGPPPHTHTLHNWYAGSNQAAWQIKRLLTQTDDPLKQPTRTELSDSVEGLLCCEMSKVDNERRAYQHRHAQNWGSGIPGT